MEPAPFHPERGEQVWNKGLEKEERKEKIGREWCPVVYIGRGGVWAYAPPPFVIEKTEKIRKMNERSEKTEQ